MDHKIDNKTMNLIIDLLELYYIYREECPIDRDEEHRKLLTDLAKMADRKLLSHLNE